MEYMSALQGELDEGKPSLFELLSEQQLAALLPPTVRYLLVVATQRYPRYLLRILNSYDEVYALLDLLVQRHFLRTYGGGFTENFYGMKRERVLAIKGGEAVRAAAAAPGLMRSTLKLSERDVWKNLAVMVGLPYLKRRLDESYEIHGAPAVQQLLGTSNVDRLPHDATWRQKFQFYYRWFLRNVYPSMNAAYYFAMLSFQLAYLFDNTAYSSPFLWMIRTRIRRLGPADFLAIEALSAPKPAGGKADKSAAARPGQSLSFFHPRNLTAAAVPRLLSSLRILLPASIFALKFLEWWHASDFARQLSRKAAEGLELPPPIVAGVSEPTTKAAAAAAAVAAAAAKSKNDSSENGNNSPTQGSPRRSAMKQSSSVALANRPSTPPNGGNHAHDSSGSSRGGVQTPSTPSSPVSSRGGMKKSFSAPIAASSGLPILTVPRPTETTSSLCPICVKPVVTPTAAQTGFVFCYTCIFKWVQGAHERQEAWMRGEGGEEGWGEDDDELERAARVAGGLGARGVNGNDGFADELSDREKGLRSRVGRWDSGEGRCAVTGRRLLGGTEGLRRIMV